MHNWITERMNGSINKYISFINKVKDTKYPIRVKFGLEVCYIPETASDAHKQSDVGANISELENMLND